jgi:hypothetical protein
MFVLLRDRACATVAVTMSKVMKRRDSTINYAPLSRGNPTIATDDGGTTVTLTPPSSAGSVIAQTITGLISFSFIALGSLPVGLLNALGVNVGPEGIDWGGRIGFVSLGVTFAVIAVAQWWRQRNPIVLRVTHGELQCTFPQFFRLRQKQFVLADFETAKLHHYEDTTRLMLKRKDGSKETVVRVSVPDIVDSDGMEQVLRVVKQALGRNRTG